METGVHLQYITKMFTSFISNITSSTITQTKIAKNTTASNKTQNQSGRISIWINLYYSTQHWKWYKTWTQLTLMIEDSCSPSILHRDACILHWQYDFYLNWGWSTTTSKQHQDIQFQFEYDKNRQHNINAKSIQPSIILCSNKHSIYVNFGIQHD